MKVYKKEKFNDVMAWFGESCKNLKEDKPKIEEKENEDGKERPGKGI
jgi:hypothetical protein